MVMVRPYILLKKSIEFIRLFVLLMKLKMTKDQIE